MAYRAFLTLDPTTIIRGFFTLAFTIVSIIIGIKLILKFFKRKDKIFLTAGFTWILFSSSWWGFTFSFLFILLFNYQLDPPVYIFLVHFFLPIALIFWSYTWSKLYNKDLFKQTFYFLLSVCLLLQTIIIITFFIDPSYIQIHIPSNPNLPDGFAYQRTIISFIISFCLLSIYLVTGILIGYRTIQTEDPKIYWKGRFLILAILISIIGVVIDLFSVFHFLVPVVARILIIISSIFYYFSFFLPKNVAKILIKEWIEDELEINTMPVENVQDFFKYIESKPEKFTEEEITSYRKQNICLVCKNEISGRAFMHDCEVLYCGKCKNVLITLENICWACQKALDETKPVKKPEEIEPDLLENIINEYDEEKQKKKNEKSKYLIAFEIF